MDQTKLDCLPNIEHVIKMADLYNKADIKSDPFHWNRDQKPDFYLGMFAAMRIFQSGIVQVQKTGATLEQLEMECFGRLGEIATIILDKYDLSTFKT